MGNPENLEQKSAHAILLDALSVFGPRNSVSFLVGVFGSLAVMDLYHNYLGPRRRLKERRALLAYIGRIEDKAYPHHDPLLEGKDPLVGFTKPEYQERLKKEAAARLNKQESSELGRTLLRMTGKDTPENEVLKLESELDRLLRESIQAAVDKLAAMNLEHPQYRDVSDAISRVRGLLSGAKVA